MFQAGWSKIEYCMFELVGTEAQYGHIQQKAQTAQTHSIGSYFISYLK